MFAVKSYALILGCLFCLLAGCSDSSSRASDALQSLGDNNAPPITSTPCDDCDHDGLLDAFELLHGLDPTNPNDGALSDIDNDGIVTWLELEFNHDPKVADVTDNDNDGIPDNYESMFNYDPTLTDTDSNGIADGQEDYDNDGLYNQFELFVGTNSLVANQDNDQDGLPDAWESLIITIQNNGQQNVLATHDFDGDGLHNAFEFRLFLNPLLPDSNQNNVIDSLEDSDGDQISNRIEQIFGLDPTHDESHDQDGDGLSDIIEQKINSDPTIPNSINTALLDFVADSDNDGFSNGYEIMLGLNPTQANDDTNTNNIPDTLESMLNIDLAATTNDSDNDQLPDNFEDALGLNKHVPDADANGNTITDSLETNFNYTFHFSTHIIDFYSSINDANNLKSARIELGAPSELEDILNWQKDWTLSAKLPAGIPLLLLYDSETPNIIDNKFPTLFKKGANFIAIYHDTPDLVLIAGTEPSFDYHIVADNVVPAADEYLFFKHDASSNNLAVYNQAGVEIISVNHNLTAEETNEAISISTLYQQGITSRAYPWRTMLDEFFVLNTLITTSEITDVVANPNLSKHAWYQNKVQGWWPLGEEKLLPSLFPTIIDLRHGNHGLANDILESEILIK